MHFTNQAKLQLKYLFWKIHSVLPVAFPHIFSNYNLHNGFAVMKENELIT